ncbi:tripartite tricarboxylate transporter TctB family protein [Afifella sp. IM 167]|uniref:tripartite tricarboxylate transporter TctB family protein n=1 Tax=Afifella sp. IM 167 TaxID=2033586 RepID=UPI001CC9BDE5|nr:tripartite tricarboxylate transporter TctB family protein [Afifella sp. IM 167]
METATAARPSQIERFKGPIIEWLVWLAIAGFAYWQTIYFAKDIVGYPPGAAGWPRTICILMALGATGQLLYKLAGHDLAEPAPAAAKETHTGAHRVVQRLAIFALPFLFLYVSPWIGFYVAAPLFVITLMLLLEVRSPLAIAGVTLIVYALFLLLFTRFFFVALPNGRLDGFYEVNNAIIGFARMGL